MTIERALFHVKQPRTPSGREPTINGRMRW